MTQTQPADTDEPPHYLGHRQRLRQRFLEGGSAALADYELLEMLLFSAKARGDVKPLAKTVLKTFGSFARTITAAEEDLRKIPDMGDAAICALKVVQAAMTRMLQEQVAERPIIQNWSALLDYAKVSMAYNKIEEFRILFLNKRNELIRDEVQQRGTVDHTPIYIREVVKRTLELGASSLILLHNHPSGDCKPSKSDIDITLQIIKATAAIHVNVHDHLVISERGHYSFRANGVI